MSNKVDTYDAELRLEGFIRNNVLYKGMREDIEEILLICHNPAREFWKYLAHVIFAGAAFGVVVSLAFFFGNPCQ